MGVQGWSPQISCSTRPYKEMSLIKKRTRGEGIVL